jgi:hypothetical protein
MKGLLNAPTLFIRAALALALAASLFVATRISSAQAGACTRTVTNTGDSGAGSLRQAIADANAAAGADTICFNIPATDPRHLYYADDGVAGQVSQANVTATTAPSDSSIAGIDPDWPHSWWTVKPASVLPTITGAVTLDGYTQPGAAQNTLAAGDNAVLRVELDGTDAGPGDGLVIKAGSSTVRGLVVNRFATLPGDRTVSGIALQTAGGNHVEGNFVGTDVSGTLALGNEIAGPAQPHLRQQLLPGRRRRGTPAQRLRSLADRQSRPGQFHRHQRGGHRRARQQGLRRAPLLLLPGHG